MTNNRTKVKERIESVVWIIGFFVLVYLFAVVCDHYFQ